ncbi:MAG: AAA family ATPase [Bryobacterales bacterium]|nr:AAA family ATPase [Bryobacterales bacterium]
MKWAGDMIESRGLPAAPESERIVLGSCLGDVEVFDHVRLALDETSFSLTENRRLWVTLCEARDAGIGVDRAAIAQRLKERGLLEAVGGFGRLVDLDADIPHGLVLDPHLDTLNEKATLRRAIVALNQALLRCVEPGNDSAEALAYARGLIEKIEKNSPIQTPLQSIGAIIEAVGIEEFCAPKASMANATPLPDEWPEFRKIYPFFRPGQLIVLAAHTSQGKSAMALHIALSCVRRGLPVAMFSMEMDNLEIGHRAASHLAEVDSYVHLNGHMTKEERLRYQAAAAQLCELPLLIDDRTASTVPAIVASMARTKTKPRLVIVDYLQIMEAAGRADTRASAVAEISRGLKRLATQYQVPVLALSQFNRDAAKQRRRPELYDLRESGAIEQDASTALFILAKQGDEDKPFMEVTIDVAKNRGGRKGEVRMMFEKPYSRFTEIGNTG